MTLPMPPSGLLLPSWSFYLQPSSWIFHDTRVFHKYLKRSSKGNSTSRILGAKPKNYYFSIKYTFVLATMLCKYLIRQLCLLRSLSTYALLLEGWSQKREILRKSRNKSAENICILTYKKVHSSIETSLSKAC